MFKLRFMFALFFFVACPFCRAGETASRKANFLSGVKGINLANALEAPHEGDWGVVLEEKYFDVVKAAGFTLVRIPVAFSAHANEATPFAVDEIFLNRIDTILGWAEARTLKIVLSFHSYAELYQQPDVHRERFIAIWEQITKRFAGRYPECVYELLNEPHAAMTAEIWNTLLADTIARIRLLDSDRWLVLGSINYSDFAELGKLIFPNDGKNLLATFHYYRPYEFTHQGAEWAEGSDKWLGKKWSGDTEEMEAIQKDFAAAAAWRSNTGFSLFLGEFGCIPKADSGSRSRWARCVSQEAEKHGFGWAWWDFAGAFPIYDVEKAKFDTEMLDALMASP